MAVVVPELNLIVLKLNYPERVLSTIKRAQVIEHEGQQLVAVPLTLTSTKLLENLKISTEGLEVIRYKYQWPLIRGKYNFRPDQITTAAFLTTHFRAYCLHPPRLGKTASAIAAADFLVRRGVGKAILVISPNTPLKNTWRKEWTEVFPLVPIGIVSGTHKKKMQVLNTPYHVYGVNYEALRNKELLAKIVSMVKSGFIQVCIVDEIAEIANTQAAVWDNVNAVVRHSTYAWGLNGTVGGPEKVYGQVKMFTPDNVPRHFASWRAQTMYQIGNPAFRIFKANPQAEQRIHEAMQPAIRFRKSDVMDVPTPQVRMIQTELSIEQIKMFKVLKEEMFAVSGTGSITVQSKRHLAQKLIQIAGGAVLGDKDAVIECDITPRIDAIRELIDSSEYKTLIFATNNAVIDKLMKDLSKFYSCVKVNGTVKDEVRAEAIRKFQDEVDPRVMICHPKTTAYSIELGMADTAIFYGPPMNGTILLQQSVERIQSSMQKSLTPVIAYLTSCKAEDKILNAVLEDSALERVLEEIFDEVIDGRYTDEYD